ncbi:sulfatase [Lutibacter citreus]|uniref:sulfatase n=1 Tax=Lutibacter citreus TaxID=2138210 RepID=UPI000DBE051A|nr:sulfatase [Lutibacter citreus]
MNNLLNNFTYQKIYLVQLILLLLIVSQLQAQQPNILFIAADDLNCDISPYGVSQVKTPNLERLAKMSMQFNNAYCQQPLCGPSRASLMTGMRPNTIGSFTLSDKLRRRKPDVVTLGQFFKEAGYYSGRVGKIYHYGNPKDIGTNGHDDERTWTERFNPAGIDKIREDEIISYGNNTKAGNRQLGISMAWWNPESEDEEHTDGMVASKAIEMIEAHKEEPFFIAAGFFNPHCPYVAPKKYFDLYDIDKIEMQDLKKAKAALEDVPEMATMRDTKAWPYYFDGVTVEEAKQCKLAYYASISFVDAQIGRLLDTLEENNLMENTIVVFWSDHGYFLGEKGLWYKRKAFERSARVPLFVKVPKGPEGVSCNKPVELIDLYPTLVDYSGFSISKDLEGKSLRLLLENPKAKWKDYAITQVHYNVDAQGYSIRNEKWRYTERNKGKAGRELYNHENDPEEITNLAKNPRYSNLIDSLSHKLQVYSDTYKPNSKKKK